MQENIYNNYSNYEEYEHDIGSYDNESLNNRKGKKQKKFKDISSNKKYY